IVDIRLTDNKFSWNSEVRDDFTVKYAGFFLETNISMIRDATASGVFHSINDNYAFVSQIEGNRIIATVDHVRSIPLFYHYKQNEFFYLTDDPVWLREKLGINNQSKVAASEFLFSGYVIGKKTLYEGLLQIQAGEYLIFDIKSGHLDVRKHYQYTPEPRTSDSRSLDTLLEELDEVHNSIGKRLVESLNGRRAVVPLSGGYDSRLVLEMLHRQKYDNILTFTYGRKHLNWEANISRKIAKYYGVSWHLEPLDRKEWYDNFRSESFKKFADYGHDYTSLAHFQDFLAVDKMFKSSILFENDILVPGHTGDFIQGGHIPNVIYKNGLKTDDIYDYVKMKHFGLWRSDPESDQLLNASLIDYFREQLALKPDEEITKEDFVKALEFFNWAERQSKYIVNSVRVYDYFNMGFRLPLWDLEMTQFWSEIPIDLKFERSLYLKYVEKYEKHQVKMPFYLKGMTGKRLDYYLFNRVVAEWYGRINGNKPLILALFEKVQIHDQKRYAYSLNSLDYAIAYFQYLDQNK
ncbi:MAG: asparagine synthase C-terminal domain-containing protein, partial [Cyclobacteriaceae bacterium]